jgi:hypothetical protein
VCPSFGPSLCPSDNFSDANPDPTSDRPSDGPDFCPTFCPTFSRRGYCKNNDHVSPLAGRRHGSKSAVANFRTASWGTEPVVVRCWCAGIAAYLFYKNSAMAECISGLSAYKMLWPWP